MGITGKEDEALFESQIDLKNREGTGYASNPVTNFIDRLIEIVGSFFSWFWVLTVLVIIWSVVSRYAFAQGSVMLEEVQWHLAGTAWLVGLSYTFVKDAHVRVDVLHERLNLKTRAWVEMLGIVFLFLPFIAIAIWELIPYALSSFQQAERSQAPNGLPYRWVLKLLMPVAMMLLFLAGVARLFKVVLTIFPPINTHLNKLG